MRIAMIIQSYYPHIGGAERQLAAIAPRMKERGHDVRIYTRRYDTNLAPYEEIDGVQVYRLPTPGPKAAASLSFTLSAQSKLLKFRPDVIHAHELLSPSTTAVLAKQLLNVPVVAKVLTGGSYGDVWKLQHRWSGRTRAAIFVRQIDRFIAISQEINSELADIEIPASQRVLIPNGVDVERFSPLSPIEKQQLRQTLGIPQGPIAIFSGRLTQQKRLDLLIEAWEGVRTHHPNATLIILGTGEDEQALHQMARERFSENQGARCEAGENQLDENCIKFIGRTEDVAPYLKAADLFVLPSSAEGLSNSLLEAMATGLPAVVTNVGAAPELIETGKNGWLVPPEQSAELSQAIVNAFDQKDALPDFGKWARQKVVQDYSLTSVVDKLINLYATLTKADSSSLQKAAVKAGIR